MVQLNPIKGTVKGNNLALLYWYWRLRGPHNQSDAL